MVPRVGRARKEQINGYGMTSVLIPSEVESRRFGMRIYRGRCESLPLKALEREIREGQVDIAFLRLPCEVVGEFSQLNRLGFPWHVADTLVYYHSDLDKISPTPLRNIDLDFVRCEPEHQGILEAMVAKIFPDYTNHYSSNPYLPKGDILSGYQEWVTSFLGEPDKAVWIANRDGRPVGFATCSFDSPRSCCEGVLYGVMPEETGGGVYGDLIRFTQAFFRDEGYRTMNVSTQIQNHAVQKVWSRESFVLRESLNTIHINSLLSYSGLEIRSFELTIRSEDVESFGQVSGDYNPLHFNDAYARARGFEERVAHGLIVNSVLSKYFGTEFPGPGTMFMSYRYKFLRPLYLDTPYKVTVSFPFSVEEKGIYYAVAKVSDVEENLCLVSYNDLIRPRE